MDGWLLLTPDCIQGLTLRGRRAALFLDAIPMEFGASYRVENWDEDGVFHSFWKNAQQTLCTADSIITFSRHVAMRQVVGLFGMPAARITVVPHAPPDLAAQLPFLAADRRRTPASQTLAADLLRRHAAERGWTYLLDFPFEDVTYIAVSTQDRPTKNIPLVIEAVRRLIRRDHVNIKLLMTTVIEMHGSGTAVPDALRETRLHLDAVSLPRLPEAEHAALYHCAAVTVHPALFEGGATAFPFPESVSLGTPCLVARGPHIEEMLATYPELAAFVFDPYDVDALVALIRTTIDNRDAVLALQLESFERMKNRTWGQVADEYARAVLRPEPAA